MKNDEIKQDDSIKKVHQHKNTIAAVYFVLILFVAIIAPLSAMRPKTDSLSGDAIIRRYAKQQLNKYNGYKLTDEDFANFSEFYLRDIKQNNRDELMYILPWVITELTDIRLLGKFTNLEQLDLTSIRYPKSKIPKCMKYLAKYGILDIDKKYAIDLSPIKNLSSLKKLRLDNSQICDIKPLKNLTNLEELYIQNCPNINDKQVEELNKALPNLKIIR